MTNKPTGIKIVRIILTLLLLFPTAFFLLFLVGEVLAGDLSGFTHLIQAGPFILLIFLIWKLPLRRKK